MHRLARSVPPGVLAAGPALLALLVGPLLLGGPGILELVADGILRAVPVAAFEAALAALGPLAKGTLFLAVSVGAVLAGGLLGAALARSGPVDGRSAIVRGFLAAGPALALAELVVLPLAGAGLAGMDYGGSAVALHLPIAVAAVLFGATFALVEPARRRPSRVEPSRATLGPEDRAPAAEAAAAPSADIATAPVTTTAPSAVAAAIAATEVTESPSATGIPRRSVLAGGLALAALGASGIVAVGRVTTAAVAGRVPDRRPAAAGGFGPTPAITPIDDHYVVAKGLAPPSIDGSAWRLAVDGLVGRPLDLSLAEVQALASAAEARTLICISNPVAEFGPYAGTQLWTGTPVAAVIEAAGGPAPDARFVLWTSADGYTESIPLDIALDPRSLLAWGMGEEGAPLPVEHGYPLRVLLPGRYGMKQPKWLTGITLAAEDVDGYWEERGWDREAVVRTWSRIDDPRNGDTVAAGRPLAVFGVAFAGERGIRGVEVSPDDGATWIAAELEAAGTELAWVRWRASMAPPAAGALLLRVRATDGTGALQAETPEPPLPRGAAGWQRVRVIAG